MIPSSTEPKESSRLSWNALNTQSFCSAFIQGMDPDDMAPMYVTYTSLDQGRYELYRLCKAGHDDIIHKLDLNLELEL